MGSMLCCQIIRDETNNTANSRTKLLKQKTLNLDYQSTIKKTTTNRSRLNSISIDRTDLNNTIITYNNMGRISFIRSRQLSKESIEPFSVYEVECVNIKQVIDNSPPTEEQEPEEEEKVVFQEEIYEQEQKEDLKEEIKKHVEENKLDIEQEHEVKVETYEREARNKQYILELNKRNNEKEEYQTISFKGTSSLSLKTTQLSSVFYDDQNIPSYIEVIKSQLSVAQVTFVLNILSDINWVNDELDKDILRPLISIIKYIKVEPNSEISFFNSHSMYLYIIESGQVINENESTITTGSCFSRENLGEKIYHFKTQKTTQESTYLFAISIEAYGRLIRNYFMKLKKDKLKYINSVLLFKYLDKSILAELSEHIQKKFYYHDENEPILSDEEIPDRIFIVAQGNVLCYEEGKFVKKISSEGHFGEIALFCNMESYCKYIPEGEVIIFELKFEHIIEVLGQKYLNQIVQAAFNNTMAKSNELCRLVEGNSTNSFFDLFSLKYYFKDTICSRSNKKIGILISGRLYNQTSKEKTLINPGDLFGIRILDEDLELEKIYSDGECVVIEAYWSDIIKKVQCPQSYLTLYDKMKLIKQTKIFSHLTIWKVFCLTENLKLEVFKEKEIVLKELLLFNKFYLIKSGKANLYINNNFVKELDKGEYFGEITGNRHYSQPTTIIANTRLELFVIDKKVYEETIEEKNLGANRKISVVIDTKITLENLYFAAKLGYGSFGKVFKVHNGKNFYAVKVAEIKKLNENKISKYFINEKFIMSSIDHPFIVKMVNTLKSKEHIFILMECIEGITLQDYLSNNNRIKKDIYETQFYGAILLTIAHYLQRVRVIHRDIKPQNCMIERNGYLKLIDFGIAKDMIGRDHTNSLVGTSFYIAPEVIHGKGYSFSADYWSIGVILYEMFYGSLPFGNNSMSLYEVYTEIAEKKLNLSPDKKFVEINNFLKAILNKDPAHRICNLQKVKTHQFFKGFKWEMLLNMTLDVPQNFKKMSESLFKNYDEVNQNLLQSTQFQFCHYIENEYYSKAENDYQDVKDNKGKNNWLEHF